MEWMTMKMMMINRAFLALSICIYVMEIIFCVVKSYVCLTTFACFFSVWYLKEQMVVLCFDGEIA